MPDDDPVAAAFQAITTAWMVLKPHEPGAGAASLRQQIERSYFLDPTLALRVQRQQADMDRKLRMLDAAAAFVRTIDAELEGALTQLGQSAESRGLATPPRSVPIADR